MVSSVWIGSVGTSVIWQSGDAAMSTVPLVWHAPPLARDGVTVSAQAALCDFAYSDEGGPTLPVGSARAFISSYRPAPLGTPWITVNAPTLNNVANVLEIIFELSVTAFEGVDTAAAATMVGTVFIQ